MTRLLRFAKLRKRRGEIEAGKRLVGWPSTRSGGSVVQVDRLARMDGGTLRVEADVAVPAQNGTLASSTEKTLSG
jgi:hypothetical protein